MLCKMIVKILKMLSFCKIIMKNACSLIINSYLCTQK